jgi:transposase
LVSQIEIAVRTIGGRGGGWLRDILGLPMPDFADLHRQRQQHPHVTRQLLWEEYRQANPDGYQYSRFCDLYQRWRRKQDFVLRQEHKAGEKLFVDWAGTTIPIHDPRGGPVQQAHLFVAVLGASSYTYAEATADEQWASWIGAHVRAFEFYQGVPNLVVPDNTKTGVTKACRYDPDLNPTYQEMAMHYGVGVVPARPYKPRDKAKVESGVLLVERWIIAALRHRKFFSIEELNQAIRELRDRINQRPFRKREGSRATQVVAMDKPVLSPLPAERFDLSEWSRASFVACALAQKACRDGYSALYTRAQSLFRDLAMARADGSLRSLLSRLSRIDVLVIDDWAMAPLSEPERHDSWEICEDRYQMRSTILTSQLPI